jgi:hypothetical protein
MLLFFGLICCAYCVVRTLSSVSFVLQNILVYLFVSLDVRGKPRMYYSLLAYCTTSFERSNFWPPDTPAPNDAFRTLAAEVGTYGRD